MPNDLFFVSSVTAIAVTLFFLLLSIRLWRSVTIRTFIVLLVNVLIWQSLQIMGVLLPLPEEIKLEIWRLILCFSLYSVLALTLLIAQFCNYKPPKMIVFLGLVLGATCSFLVLNTSWLIKGLGNVSQINEPIIFGPLGGLLGVSFLLPLFYSLKIQISALRARMLSRLPLILIGLGIIAPTMITVFSIFVLPLFGITFLRLTPLALVIIVSSYIVVQTRWKITLAGFRVRTRMIIGIGSSLGATILVADLLLYYYVPRLLIRNELNSLSVAMTQVSKNVDGYIKGYRDQLSLLAAINNLGGLLDASSSATNRLQSNYANIEKQFSLQIESHPEILNITLSSETGSTLIAVNNHMTASVTATSAGALEAKDLIETLRLKPGQIFVSPIHLEKDAMGNVIYPLSPVIEMATPILNAKSTQGVLSIRYDFKPIFTPIPLKNQYQGIYIVDRNGFFLDNPDNTKEWGGPDDRNTGIKLQTEFPWLAEKILGSSSSAIDANGQLISSLTYTVSTSNQNSIIFIRIEPKAVILTDLIDLAKLIGGTEVTGIILMLILGSLIARSVSAPLSQLLDRIKKLEEGDLNVQLAIDSPDEIGQLSRILDASTKQLIQQKNSIAAQVQQRTMELRKQIEETEKSKQAMVNVLEDLSEEQKASTGLAADLKKFQLAVENVSDHVIITDPDGYILYANPAAELVTGYSRREIMGTKAGSLWGKQMSQDYYRNLWQTIKIEKKLFTGEINNQRKNGQEYIAETRISPILDSKGEVFFFVGIERDITKAKEIDRMKTEFISLASHQMRTPLSAMRWFSELLLDTTSGKLSYEQRDYVNSINQSCIRLIELVNSLLDISRIESGRLTVEPVPTQLENLIRDVLQSSNEKIMEKKLSVSISIPKEVPEINIDPKLITQVYANLITNSIKYTSEGGSITISVDEKGDSIISEIKDTGVGIPRLQQHHVFERFFRADNVMKTSPGGTGLGLYLAKEIVEASGGKIGFQSEENKGTTFWFSLPKSGSTAKTGEVTLSSAE